MPSQYTYLVLMLLTLAFPLSHTWDRRISYYRTVIMLWPGLVATALFFIAWDVWATYIGVWAFTDRFVLGYYMFGLPVEEWLFFAIVPFSCIFIYECVRFYFPEITSGLWARILFWGLVSVLSVTALLHTDRWYTSVKLGLTAIMLVIHWRVFGYKYLGQFFVAYGFTLIPFLLVNGVLTWMPVVTYDNDENLGIRIGQLIGMPFFNIPIEDTMYSLLLLLMNMSWLAYKRESVRESEYSTLSEKTEIRPTSFIQ
jgi:lycopene cyclase domain-containing protein